MALSFIGLPSSFLARRERWEAGMKEAYSSQLAVFKYFAFCILFHLFSLGFYKEIN